MLGAGCSAAVAEAVGAVCISAMMLQRSGALVGLAVQTVSEVSEYSKLLFPVMAAAASARGAVTSASAISIGTSALTAFLNSFLRRMMVPAIYLFLTASVANAPGTKLTQANPGHHQKILRLVSEGGADRLSDLHEYYRSCGGKYG